MSTIDAAINALLEAWPAVAMCGDSESMYAALQAYDSLLELREMEVQREGHVLV